MQQRAILLVGAGALLGAFLAQFGSPLPDSVAEAGMAAAQP